MQIADFGLSRLHDALTTGRINTARCRTIHLNATPGSKAHHLLSIRYLVLGGILSEVVAWTLGGSRELEGFRKERYITSVSSP